MNDFLTDPFGLHADSLGACQMMLRAIVVFFVGLALIRMSGFRTIGKSTAFDQLTLLVIGSMLGRSVVTGKSFFGVLAASLVIVLLQLLLSWFTFRSKAMGKIFKGEARLLISSGQKQEKNMSRTLISDEDILEALRISLHTESADDIQEAYLERSGHIAFIKRKADPP